MKYILALGIGFKKYNKPLQVTISSKYLIDLLQLDKNINLVPAPVFEKGHKWYQWQMPEKLFFFEISDHAIGNEFKLDFDCEDNNYTNGFMSTTSLVLLRTAFIIPKKLLKYYFDNRHTERFHNIKYKRFNDPHHLKTPIHDKNIFEGNCWPYQRQTWQWNFGKPQQSSECYDRDLGRYISSQYWDNNPGWVGGKFSVTMEVIKKPGIKMFNPYPEKNKKYGQIWTNLYLYEKSLEKYYKLNMVNEDQRSHS